MKPARQGLLRSDLLTAHDRDDDIYPQTDPQGAGDRLWALTVRDGVFDLKTAARGAGRRPRHAIRRLDCLAVVAAVMAAVAYMSIPVLLPAAVGATQ